LVIEHSIFKRDHSLRMILFYLLAETEGKTTLSFAIRLFLNVNVTNMNVTSSPTARPHNI
jgi:hypothetical protein